MAPVIATTLKLASGVNDVQVAATKKRGIGRENAQESQEEGSSFCALCASSRLRSSSVRSLARRCAQVNDGGSIYCRILSSLHILFIVLPSGALMIDPHLVV